MDRFKRWLIDRLRHKKGQAEDDETREPLSYRSNWPIIHTPTEKTGTSYSLFEQLPLEIRRQILGEAFGNRTLHIDLAFDHPLVRKSSSQPKKRLLPISRANPEATARTHCGYGSELVRDTTKPKTWQWFSCVCHRRLVEIGEDGPGLRRIEPCEDWCIPCAVIGKKVGRSPRSGSLCLCESADYGTSWSHDCFVGVMGWLLACRQAYMDGMDVLYKTNTFHLASLPLLSNLPRLMSPRVLGTITSLEMLWNFQTPDLFNDEVMNSIWDTAQASSAPVQSSAFHDLCQMVPLTFPNVRHLYIALQAFIVPPHTFHSEDLVADVERVILGPVEDMFRRLRPGPEKTFSLAIQQGGWHVFADRLTKRDPRAQWSYEIFDDSTRQDRLWKPLDDSSGYWLRQGWDDFDTFGVSSYWMFDIWKTGRGPAG